MSESLNTLDAVNSAIRATAPRVFQALSELGKQSYFPPDIPFQAAQARQKTFNATIGQITDGKGLALPMECLQSGVALESDQLNKAMLYSPIEGIAELRSAWRDWQRKATATDAVSGLPFVTVGLTHGLSLIADLFAGPGRAVAVATPYWGNYRQTFALRRGARMLSAPAYTAHTFNPRAWSQALGSEPSTEPAIALVNLPSNPGGYSPTTHERQALIESLLETAALRPLIVVCDDAYAGLVYEPEIPHESLFWELCDRHPNLIPIKLDGSTKELAFFGGRVGFISFNAEQDSPLARAIESKLKALSRATVGSPVATSQVLLLRALRSQSLVRDVELVRATLQERYQALKTALQQLDQKLVKPLPCNSGCFALMEIPPELELSSERVRLDLLDNHDTGLVAIAPNYLRIAYCSVASNSLNELIQRLEHSVRGLTNV